MSQTKTKFQLFGKFTGLHMVLCMSAFFGVIIAVNLFMATLASSSWTGLVVKNTYVASQQFNKHLSAAQNQKQRGWHSSILFNNDEFEFSFFDKNANLINLEKVQLFIGRPAFEQQDQLIALTPAGVGTYLAKLPLAYGEWKIRITGSIEEQNYRRDERLFVDAKGLGRIELGSNK